MAALQAASLLRAPFSSSSARRQHLQQRARRPVAPRAQAEQQPEQPAAEEAKPRADTCATCGVPLSEKPFGCDGSGRINGGIGAVPGFRWWPIKAYRPCPKATAAGVVYRRKGQILDEVLFGKGRQ